MEIKDIERSIIKKYRKDIWRKFTTAVTDYNLISDDDVIGVCISGGKDSFLLAKCLDELKRHGKIKFDIKYICMDPGYNKTSIKKTLSNAKKLGIKLEVFNTDIFQIVKNNNKGAPCYLCAKMRRGYLYHFAKTIGCNKIALGHHFDDVIETIMLSMLYSGQFQTMLPKLHSANFENIELIRPLYLVKEESILSWMKYINMDFIGCACSLKEENSKRKEVKELINTMRKTNKFVDKNIFKSSININLNQVLGYYKDDEIFDYIKEYDK